MKLLGYLLGACVVLAIVRAAALALAIALVLAIVIGLLARPSETFGLVLLMFAVGVIQIYPALCAVLAGVVVVISVSAKKCQPPS